MKKIINFVSKFYSNISLVEKIILFLIIVSNSLGGNDKVSSIITMIVIYCIIDSVIERMYNHKTK